MRCAWLIAFVALAACKTPTVPAASATAPAAPPPVAADAPPAPVPAAAASVYTLADLRGLGAELTVLDGGETLVCGAGARNCVCLAPLPCAAAGNCPTFDDNLKGFRTALSATGDRSVTCRRAETGRCGDFRYFDFEGDIERRELRWFDSAGHLIAQRNRTDHAAYCNGRSLIRFMGAIPRCPSLTRDELICGKAPHPLPPAIDEILQRAPGTSARPPGQ